MCVILYILYLLIRQDCHGSSSQLGLACCKTATISPAHIVKGILHTHIVKEKNLYSLKRINKKFKKKMNYIKFYYANLIFFFSFSFLRKRTGVSPLHWKKLLQFLCHCLELLWWWFACSCIPCTFSFQRSFN